MLTLLFVQNKFFKELMILEVVKAFFSMLFHLFYQVDFLGCLALLCLTLYVFFLFMFIVWRS